MKAKTTKMQRTLIDFSSSLRSSNISSNNSTTLTEYSGFFLLLGSSFFFGSNYLPVKQYETGDGLFFQLILSIAVWTVGFFVNWFRNFPKFEIWPMLGGLLWTTGNLNTVAIIRCIGIGLGIIFWGTISLITGWTTVYFGWFGIKPVVPSDPNLNYIGILFAFISGFFFLFVQSSTTINLKNDLYVIHDDTNSNEDTLPQPTPSEIDSDEENLIVIAEDSIEVRRNDSEDFFDRLGKPKKRVIGISLACFSGIMYGECMAPVIYIRERDKTDFYIDYMYSFYTGIFLTSLLYFIIYCIIKKNRPVVYANLILPGLVSGWMWAVANIFYFLSIQVLSREFAFPISNCGPPMFSLLWGVILYREINGLRNFLFLFLGFIMAIAASIFLSLSF